ncbi:hypothetical protein [Oceanobacillus sojae]
MHSSLVGAGGIGAAIVKKIAQEEAKVAFTYVHAEEKAQKVVSEMKALGQ